MDMQDLWQWSRIRLWTMVVINIKQLQDQCLELADPIRKLMTETFLHKVYICLYVLFELIILFEKELMLPTS